MEHHPPPPPPRQIHRFGFRTTLIAAGALALIPLAGLIVLITTGWAPLHTLDLDIVHLLTRYAAGHRGPVQFWKIVSIIGGPTVLRVAAFLAVLLLWRGHRRSAILLTAAMSGAAALSGIFKVLVNRGRPVVAVPVDHADSASFPSGHALTCFVAAGVLLMVLLPHTPRRRRPLLIVAAALLVVAVAFSRLLLGVHYLSDVLGSWLIGASLLLILAGVFHRLHGAPYRRPAARTQPRTGPPEPDQST